MKLRFTLDALAHVNAIHHYVEFLNARAATRVTERIFAEIARLGRLSHLGHLGIVLGTLEWIVSSLPYVIVFEPNEEMIIVKEGVVEELGGDADWALWPPQYGWWLSRRAEQLRRGEKDVKEGRIAAVFNR